MDKKNLRSQLRERLEQMTPGVRQRKSQAAGELLCQSPEFQQARVVMMFLSIPGELDTISIIRQGLGGKTVLVPKINWDKWLLIPVELRSLDEPMEFHRYGLQWPTDRPDFPLERIELVIVPGLGFDETGRRIGRGGRFLRPVPGPAGVAGAQLRPGLRGAGRSRGSHRPA